MAWFAVVRLAPESDSRITARILRFFQDSTGVDARTGCALVMELEEQNTFVVWSDLGTLELLHRIGHFVGRA